MRRRAALAAGLVAALVAPAAAAAEEGGVEPAAEPSTWVITAPAGHAIDPGALPTDVEVTDRLEHVGAVVVEATPEAAERLRADRRIGTVEPDRTFVPALDAAVPAVHADVVQALGRTGAGRTVALVDTGVAAHPTFGTPYSEVCFVGAASTVPCPGGGTTATGPGAAAPPCTDTDACLHGTHVAGIAVGRGGGGASPGVATGAGLLAVRIFGIVNDRLTADTPSLLAALDHVLARRLAGEPIDVVNLSLTVDGGERFATHCDGAAGVSPALRAAIDALTASGVVVVAATGNAGDPGGVPEPACFANAVAVSATDLGSPERVASFANSGPPTDLLAPGLGIRSAAAGSGTFVENGTSMATPFVSGTVAILRSAWPSASVGAIRALLASGGVVVNDPTRGTHLRLDAAASVLAIGDGIGVGRAGTPSFLRDSPTAGRVNRTVGYGIASDQLVVGDWNGDGVDTFGVRRGNTFLLTNATTGGTATIAFSYGLASDQVVVGDWDGDGRDSIGVRRGNRFYLRNPLSGGPTQIGFAYGWASDVPVVGDFDGDGRDTIGVRRGNAYYLRNHLSGGSAHLAFGYGLASDVPVIGDWTGTGRDTVGVRRGNRWLLRTSNTSGNAELDLAYGSAASPPLVGNWDGS